MDPKIPDDLLSAFHDREITPAEAAIVQAFLHQTPEARGEIADYKRLSGLLAGLPRHAAPQEFAAAVMQRAERETLLPLDEPVSVMRAARAKPIARRQSQRTWWAACAGGLVAVVAMAMYVLLPGRSERLPPETMSYTSPARFAERDGKEIGGNGRLLVANRDLHEGESVFGIAPTAKASPAHAPRASTKMENSQPLKNETGSAAAPPPASPVKVAAIANRVKLAEAAPAATTAAARMSFPPNLKTAQPGEMIEAFEKLGEQVAVVRLTVVDRQDGLDGIRSILVRNTSQPVELREQMGELAKEYPAKNGVVDQDRDNLKSVNRGVSSSSAGDLICVYVEATRDQMTGVLRDIQNEAQIHEALFSNTISVAQLDAYSIQGTSNGVPAPELMLQDEQSGKQPKSKDENEQRSKSSLGGQKAASAHENQRAKNAPARQAGMKQQQFTVNLGRAEVGRLLAEPMNVDFRFSSKVGGGAAKAARPAMPSSSPAQSSPNQSLADKGQKPGEGFRRENDLARRSPASRKRYAVPAEQPADMGQSAQRSYMVFFVLDDTGVPQSQIRLPAMAPLPTVHPSAGNAEQH